MLSLAETHSPDAVGRRQLPASAGGEVREELSSVVAPKQRRGALGQDSVRLSVPEEAK